MSQKNTTSTHRVGGGFTRPQYRAQEKTWDGRVVRTSWSNPIDSGGTRQQARERLEDKRSSDR